MKIYYIIITIILALSNGWKVHCIKKNKIKLHKILY